MEKFITNIKDISAENEYRMSPTYYKVLQNFKDAENCIPLNSPDIVVESGSYIRNYVDCNNGIPYLRVNNEKNYIIDESEMVYVDKNVKDKMKLLENDIIFGRTQANLDKLGVFSIIDKKMEGSSISQHVSKIRIKNNIISPYYLIAYLNSKFGKSQMAYATYGDTRVELTHSQVKKMKVILLDESVRNIVSENSKIIIENNRMALNALKEAQDYILEKIGYNKKEKNNKYNVKFYDLKENDIWNVTNYKPEYVSISRFIEDNTNYTTLNELIKENIKTGYEVGSKNYLIEFEKKAEDYAFIRTSDIINNTVDIYPDYFVNPHSIPHNKIPKLEKNDILFSKDAKIGETTVVCGDEKIIPCSGYTIIKIDENKVNPQYVFAVLTLNIIKDQALQKTVIASTIPHLKINKLGKIKIPILSVEDQKYVGGLVEKFIELNRIKNEKVIENKRILDEEYDKLFK